MEKIKVAHIVQTLDVGGAERLVMDLLKSCDKSRFDFTLCCLGTRGVLADELEKENVRLIFLNKKDGLDFNLSFKIASLMKDSKIGVLHTHNQRPQFYGALATHLFRPRVYVHTRHGRNYPDNYKSVLFSRFFAGRASKVVVVCDDIYKFARDIEKLPKEKLKIINNGVDTERFNGEGRDKKLLRDSLGIGPDELVIGTVGRLAKIKNQKLLILAFKNVADLRSDCRLVVVGDGPLKNELIDYSQEVGVREKILFLGERNDISQLLGVFDIFCLSSLSEGISLVLLEAMATGLPIVATRVGGNSELIEDGVNGFLVPSQDPRSMSENLVKLLSDKELRDHMSKNNQKSARSRFDIRDVTKTYQELYVNEINNTRRQ